MVSSIYKETDAVGLQRNNVVPIGMDVVVLFVCRKVTNDCSERGIICSVVNAVN